MGKKEMQKSWVLKRWITNNWIILVTAIQTPSDFSFYLSSIRLHWHSGCVVSFCLTLKADQTLTHHHSWSSFTYKQICVDLNLVIFTDILLPLMFSWKATVVVISLFKQDCVLGYLCSVMDTHTTRSPNGPETTPFIVISVF